MFVVIHAGESQEFATLQAAQEWVVTLMRNKARFTVTYRYGN